jgi:large subunit ribosomal protein L10
MPRPEKVQAVAEIKERLEHANAVFLAEYAGLSVKQQQALRRGLRAGGAEFKVVKMTLARRAAAELELADLDELLLGPTGIAFADGDAVAAAKALKDFAKDHEALSVKGGLLRGEFLTPERISHLAEIESRDVLLAKIAGVMQAPMANLAGLLAALPRNTASVVKQLIEKKEAAGDTSLSEAAEPAAAPEAATAVEVEEAAPAPDAETVEVEAEETGEAVAPAEEEEIPVDAEEAAASAGADGESDAETEVAEPVAEASAEDGDDAKSDDEDPAAEAEEE